MGESEGILNLEEARLKIQSEKPVRRRELLESFASQPGEDIDRLLMSFMEDASADVRRAVVGIMRRRGFEDPEFYSRATQDESELVRRTASAALKSLDRLRARQRSLTDHLFRRVGSSGQEKARDESYFVRLLQSKDKETRLEAIRKMSDVDTPWVGALLLRSLRDESWTNRTCAVRALVKRTEITSDMICEKLREQLWYLRSTAVEILGYRQDPSAIPRLAPLVKDANVEVRGAVAEALGRIGGDEAARVLEHLIADANYAVRTKAEKALREIRKKLHEKA